jgi:hypothetical protein
MARLGIAPLPPDYIVLIGFFRLSAEQSPGQPRNGRWRVLPAAGQRAGPQVMRAAVFCGGAGRSAAGSDLGAAPP